jgi:hypothetical protein
MWVRVLDAVVAMALAVDHLVPCDAVTGHPRAA